MIMIFRMFMIYLFRNFGCVELVGDWIRNVGGIFV